MLHRLVPKSWAPGKMELLVCTTFASSETLGGMPLVPKLGGNSANHSHYAHNCGHPSCGMKYMVPALPGRTPEHFLRDELELCLVLPT